jgi:myo-inositol-1(or 4)-monophosphatase
MKPTADYLNAADKAIRKALLTLRPQLLKAYGSIEHELKDDKTIVTETDVLVEERLRSVITEIDASVGFGGEETGVDYNQKTFWLVDPIDGTESFVRGLPFSTNMMTLVDNGQPIMAIVYNFFLDEYYLAIKGKGATCNGHAIHVSKRTIDRSYVIFGGRVSKGGEAFIGMNDRLRDKVFGMPKMNSSGYEFSAIARGAIDGCVVWHRNGHPWDFAPGTLLIQEAGGRVENLDATSYDYQKTQFVAANPIIFDELKQFITDAIAKH